MHLIKKPVKGFFAAGGVSEDYNKYGLLYPEDIDFLFGSIANRLAICNGSVKRSSKASQKTPPKNN